MRTASSRRRAHGEIADYFIPQGKRSSDIEFIISRLPEILNKHKINIVDRPSHAIPLGLDETEFTRILQEEVRYQRKEPLQHDIDALTSIHRLRKGQLSRSIESCKSIFVTTNISLARACARFFRKEYHGTTVPLCTVDNVLTTIMWVKKPITAPDLPKKRIIADCYAALNPQDNLWKIYLDEIDRLQVSGDLTDDDYNLLRYSTEARRALMDVTLGEFEAFVEGSVYEVLNRAKENLRAELEKALRLEEEQKLKALQQYDEQRDLIGKQQTIIDEQHLERLRQLSEFKAKLDQRAVTAINNSVKLYFSFICLLWLVIISFIFKFGWDVMEPWTYILGGSVPILSLGYFAARQHEFSPKTIYDKYVKAKKIKNYQEYGFDQSCPI